jgi:tetratricopeptide (TPR) repeat protein
MFLVAAEFETTPLFAQSREPTPAAATPATSEGLKPILISPGKLLTAAYGRTEQAKSPEELGSIIEDCERALAKDLSPDLEKYARQLAAWAYNRRGEIYARQANGLVVEGQQRQANELDALALDDFQAAIGYDPAKWKAVQNRGVSLALHGRFDAALADFTQVISVQANHANAWFNRAEVRLRLGRLAEAQADYTQALQLNAGDLDSLLGRGEAECRLQDYRAALADYEAVLRVQPEHAQAISGRGEVRARQRNWKGAADDFRQAIKLDPHLAAAYRGAAWLMATCPDESLRDAALAVESARKAIELAGDDDYRTLDTLAAAQASLGGYAAACQSQKKALQLAPPSAVAPLQARLDLYRAQQPYRDE